MVKVKDMENTLGKCECLNYSHKYLILRVLKQAIENQKDAINKVDSEREEILKKGMDPNQLIESSKKFIEAVQKTKNLVNSVPLCEKK